MSYSEKPTAAFVLSVIGGVLGVFGGLYFFGGWWWGFGPLICGYFVIVNCIILISAWMLYTNPASTRDWGTLVLVLSILSGVNLPALIGGILAMRWMPSNEEETKLLDSSLPKSNRPRTNLRGSYPLDEQTLHRVVSETSPGVYALGRKKSKTFYVHRVGRSDTNIAIELTGYIGKYERFKFKELPDAATAFSKECELYHSFRGAEGKLDNRNHPQRTQGALWQCPKCDAFNSPETNAESRTKTGLENHSIMPS
ncbi:MAG TPA: hypothetical protein VLV18_03075 [Terriglobales bacterium]|nr:hypothetical protein [Terriglobales bacterium]